MAHPNGLIPRRLLRGEITCRWHELTSSDVEECTSDRAKLIEVLQARYGYTRRRAEKEVELFFLEFRTDCAWRRKQEALTFQSLR